jgi:hypothetical protein
MLYMYSGFKRNLFYFILINLCTNKSKIHMYIYTDIHIYIYIQYIYIYIYTVYNNCCLQSLNSFASLAAQASSI